MYLTRCQNQKQGTLEEFYVEVSQQDSDVCRGGGQVVLKLMIRLRELPNEYRVYGLTSLSRLCLLAEDDYRSPWYVIISVLDSRNYFVEYLMPENTAPWVGAYVKGEPHSEDEAIEMIAIAMKNSEGWSTNPIS